MIAINEITAKMPISRACSLLGIPRRSYYSGKPLHIRITSSRGANLTGADQFSPF